MKKRADTLKVLVAAMVLGVLANTSAIPAYAKDRDMARAGAGDRDSRLQR